MITPHCCGGAAAAAHSLSGSERRFGRMTRKKMHVHKLRNCDTLLPPLFAAHVTCLFNLLTPCACLISRPQTKQVSNSLGTREHLLAAWKSCLAFFEKYAPTHCFVIQIIMSLLFRGLLLALALIPWVIRILIAEHFSGDSAEVPSLLDETNPLPYVDKDIRLSPDARLSQIHGNIV